MQVALRLKSAAENVHAWGSHVTIAGARARCTETEECRGKRARKGITHDHEQVHVHVALKLKRAAWHGVLGEEMMTINTK